MTIVHDQIAAQLLELDRVVATPLPPLGYGTDISCTTDSFPGMPDVDGQSPQAIIESLIRRLVTQNGSLWDDPDYGEDIRSYMNKGTTDTDLRALEAKVKNECLKDDRVDTMVVSLVFTGIREARLSLEIVPFNVNSRPFTATLAVTTSAVLLEAIG